MKKKEEEADDRRVNRMFESQNRRLNRKRLINAVGGIVLLAAILFALQFTPYGNVPRNIISAAADFVKSLTSGSSGPKEPSPKYW